MSSMRWTAEQAAAIQARGHTMLSANAGTGKTTTVVGRILWRLGFDVGVHRDSGAPLEPCPDADRITIDQVAAITFTEKAAYDLEKKLRSELRKRDPKLLRELTRAYVGTIHGFCGELLKEHALRFGIDPVFQVLDERESRLELDAIIRDELMRALERDDRDVVRIVQRYTLDGYTLRREPLVSSNLLFGNCAGMGNGTANGWLKVSWTRKDSDNSWLGGIRMTMLLQTTVAVSCGWRGA